jgi:hypothetical protein
MKPILVPASSTAGIASKAGGVVTGPSVTGTGLDTTRDSSSSRIAATVDSSVASSAGEEGGSVLAAAVTTPTAA